MDINDMIIAGTATVRADGVHLLHRVTDHEVYNLADSLWPIRLWDVAGYWQDTVWQDRGIDTDAPMLVVETPGTGRWNYSNLG
jgi:hypothetical protein